MPDESNFETNTSAAYPAQPVPSWVRLAVPEPGSKSTSSLLKYPVVYTLPDESTATEKPYSRWVPPKLLAHT